MGGKQNFGAVSQFICQFSPIIPFPPLFTLEILESKQAGAVTHYQLRPLISTQDQLCTAIYWSKFQEFFIDPDDRTLFLAVI